MTMRFLADESCDFAVVRALRRAGFDVLCISESSPRTEDSEVIRLALHEGRILLTEDKDFGRLVYSHGQDTLGVIFLRNKSGGQVYFLSMTSCEESPGAGLEI